MDNKIPPALQRQLDKIYSMSSDELDSYISEKTNIVNNSKALPTPGSSPVPTPGISKNPSPDMVNPFPNGNTEETQGFSGEHPGVDIAPVDTSKDVPVTNAIGGVPFSGTIADNGYYAGFGNYYGTIGASPKELADMTPEEKVRMQTVAKDIMALNPTDNQANELLASNFPGKNIVFSGHLKEPVKSDTQEVATGSAKLTMGDTGKSTGTHTHETAINTEGQPVSYQDLLNTIGRYSR